MPWKKKSVKMQEATLQGIAYMLPNVDTNNRNVSWNTGEWETFNKPPLKGLTKQGILVGCRHDYEFLGCRVISLRKGNEKWTSNRLRFTHTNQPHPLPWIAPVLAIIAFLNSSTEPKSRTIAFSSCPPETTFPPCALEGARFFQNSEWLIWPPPLNFKALCRAIFFVTESATA